MVNLDSNLCNNQAVEALMNLLIQILWDRQIRYNAPPLVMEKLLKSLEAC